jgi:hypothetical protein
MCNKFSRKTLQEQEGLFAKIASEKRVFCFSKPFDSSPSLQLILSLVCIKQLLATEYIQTNIFL